MGWKGRLSDAPALSKLIIFGGICLTMAGLFSLAGIAFSEWLTGYSPLSSANQLPDYQNDAVINGLKIIQMMASTGLFIAGPIISAWLMDYQPWKYLSIEKPMPLNAAVLIVLLMFISVPVINWMVELNEKMVLPSALQAVETWMKEKEKEAAALTEAFVQAGSLKGLIINIIVIALIPSLGEELFFRGFLFRFFYNATGKKHLVIFITAFLFSAIHMQFYGFFPRMALGVLLGYLLVWSGSLWLPVMAHFTNNALAVILAYLADQQQLPFNQDTIGTGREDLLYLFISIVFTGFLLVLLYRNLGRKTISGSTG